MSNENKHFNDQNTEGISDADLTIMNELMDEVMNRINGEWYIYLGSYESDDPDVAREIEMADSSILDLGYNH